MAERPRILYKALWGWVGSREGGSCMWSESPLGKHSGSSEAPRKKPLASHGVWACFFVVGAWPFLSSALHLPGSCPSWVLPGSTNGKLRQEI